MFLGKIKVSSRNNFYSNPGPLFGYKEFATLIGSEFRRIGSLLAVGKASADEQQLPDEQPRLYRRRQEQQSREDYEPASVARQPPIEGRLFLGFVSLLSCLGLCLFSGYQFYRERFVFGAALIVCGGFLTGFGAFVVWSWQFAWSWGWLI